MEEKHFKSVFFLKAGKLH